jgi:transposase
MKIQEVIVRAVSKQLLWMEAADIIGVSYRTMKRWKARYAQHGFDGLFDRRQRVPSPKRAPLRELERILCLYREKYKGFNVAHFHEKLRAEGIFRSYTFVKTALQAAGLVAKERQRGKHRQRRPRKPLVGMMLHLDGSPHRWLAGVEGMLDLLVLMDDATNEIYEGEFVDEEDTLSCMRLMRDCVAKRGIFCSLYTDRAGHFFFTPKAGGKVQEGHLTQIGRALKELGIRPIPAYSPEARGRSERMNGTLQGRLPQELGLHGIKTKEEANRFLREQFIPEFNRRFRLKPEQPGSAFVPLKKHIDLDLIFSIQQERVVAPDNTVSFQRLILQLPPNPLRVSFAKCTVTVHMHIDETLSITYGPHVLGRYDAQGRLIKQVIERVA